MKKNITLTILTTLILSFTARADIWSEIKATALAPNVGANGRALPLASSWDTGWQKYWGGSSVGTVYEPSHVVWLITTQNRHLIAHINHLGPGLGSPYTTYYNTYLTNANALGILKQHDQPITVGGIDNAGGGLIIWDRRLYQFDPYKSLPPETSPRFYGTDHQFVDRLTPFPPAISKWHGVGAEWGGSPGMDALQTLYPNPSKVIFLSDNEASKENWYAHAEIDQRYINLYGTGHDDNFKRSVFSTGWNNCYNQLFGGVLSELNSNWQNNSIFVGYETGDCAWNLFGARNDWAIWSLYHDGKTTGLQDSWDGDSISYYAGDFQVQSKQVSAQNRYFMLQEQMVDNPDFWFELSVWQGDQSYRNSLVGLGQTYDANRYKGFVQFGMWLLTPRVVRHYNDSLDRETEGFTYFNAVMDSVDSVHTDPLLKRFWQYGELVANTSQPHPFQLSIPGEFADRQRWFQLNTSLDPARPWALTAEIPVFALARVVGTPPNREWLIYAHSPLQNRTNVVVTLPGYGLVTTDVSRGGTFIHVQETAAPTIATMPADQVADSQVGAIPAGTATFDVKANGANLNFQWQKWNGSAWNNVGTNHPAYVTPPATQSDNGTKYRVVVSNSYGSSTSSAATLNVNFGCVGYWRLDETGGTTATDQSGNGNSGTLINNTQFVGSGGILNGATSFDGADDYIKVNSVPMLKYQGAEMTLSAWLYIDPTEVNGAKLISKPWNGSGQYNYILQLGADCKLSFFLQYGVAGGIGVTSPAALSRSAWHHVAATIAPNGTNSYTMNLYVDGVNVNSTTALYSGSWIPSYGDGNTALCIGHVFPANYGVSAYSLDGVLDDIRIYNHVLVPKAIAEKARCPAAWWKLDESSGSQPGDSTGNGNTGTLVNNAQRVPSEGHLGGAVLFDGTDDYIRINDASMLKYQGKELTLSAWLYINATEVSGAKIFSKPWNGSGQYNYLLQLGTDYKISFFLQYGVLGSIGITSPSGLSSSRWHHVAVTVAPSGSNNYTMNLYIDGVKVKSSSALYSASWIPSYGDGNKQLCLGHVFPTNYTSPAHSLDGKLDDLRFYNQELSSTAINELAGN